MRVLIRKIIEICAISVVCKNCICVTNVVPLHDCVVYNMQTKKKSSTNKTCVAYIVLNKHTNFFKYISLHTPTYTNRLYTQHAGSSGEWWVCFWFLTVHNIVKFALRCFWTDGILTTDGLQHILTRFSSLYSPSFRLFLLSTDKMFVCEMIYTTNLYKAKQSEYTTIHAAANLQYVC